jgi:hypothetical protein
MTVGSPSSPSCGVAVAIPSPAWAPAFPPRPLSPRSPLPERRAAGGSRFWALADESSDEEEERVEEAKVSDEVSGGVSGPSSVTLGDFLSPAWQKVSLRRSGAGGRRRNRFAPGGRRSSFGQVSAVPPPRSTVVPQGVAAARVSQPSSSPSDLQGAVPVRPSCVTRPPCSSPP